MTSSIQSQYFKKALENRIKNTRQHQAKVPDISNTCIYLLHSNSQPLPLPWSNCFFWATFNHHKYMCKVFATDLIINRRSCLFRLSHPVWADAERHRFTGAYGWDDCRLLFLHVTTFSNSIHLTLHVCNLITQQVHTFCDQIKPSDNDHWFSGDACILGTQLQIQNGNICVLISCENSLLVTNLQPDSKSGGLTIDNNSIDRSEITTQTEGLSIGVRGDAEPTSLGFWVDLKEPLENGEFRKSWRKILLIDPIKKQWYIHPISCDIPFNLDYIWYSCVCGSVIYTQLLEHQNHILNESHLMLLDTNQIAGNQSNADHKQLKWQRDSVSQTHQQWLYRTQGYWFVQDAYVPPAQRSPKHSDLVRVGTPMLSLQQTAWEALLAYFPRLGRQASATELIVMGIPRECANYLKNINQAKRKRNQDQ